MSVSGRRLNGLINRAIGIFPTNQKPDRFGTANAVSIGIGSHADFIRE